MTSWSYEGMAFQEDEIEDHVGFVYIITNLKTGMQYIGQKKFFSTRRIRKKNKKNKTLKVEPSNWKDYWGSNEKLQADVKELGPKHFQRNILHLCKNKSIMNYLELKEQVSRDVLFYPEKFYNAYVGGRISRSHVLGKWTPVQD